jgi:23S rRNA (cytosine1962-C5)-methyltransferase
MKAIVHLKKGRARPVLRRHPWIFSGSVARIEGDPEDGEIVDVRDKDGEWLARGLLNRNSQITVRLLTWDEGQAVDDLFWRRRLQDAIAARARLARDPATNAYRLVHAESDYLPGLIVDRYADFLVVQFLALGMAIRRGEIVAALADLLEPQGIYERSDVDVREKEGLPEAAGPVWGEEPPDRLEIRENDHRFWIDVRGGQKTSFYLDQRENRAQLPPFCAGTTVLDGFSYTGSFGVYAAAGGAAQVTFVDSSAPALQMAWDNMLLNGRDPEVHDFVEGDVFSVLRDYRSAGREFDVVVLDPPKFAPSVRDVDRAARAYKDINLLAFQLLRPGGVLFSTSCSGGVSMDLYQKIVFGAVLDAGRKAQIVGYLRQGSDHPVALTFPEGAYLKGLKCRVVE